MMTNQDVKLLEAIRTAVNEAIDSIGIEGVRRMSMFPSASSKGENELKLPELKLAA